MALRPYSATLQAAYRDTLGTPGAPEVIDDSTPVMPVAVVAQVNTAATSSYTRITDGTDNLAINTDGSLNAEPANKTTVLLNAARTTSGTTTLGTVPANKQWRIIYVQLTSEFDGSTLAGIVEVELNAVPIMQLNWMRLDASGQATTGGLTDSATFDYSCCPTIAAGQTVTLVSNASINTACSVLYVEVAV